MRRFLTFSAFVCHLMAIMAVGVGWAQPADSTIVAWGQNNVGQCDVPSPNERFAAVAGGRNHSLGLKSDGTIVAWGENLFGQCNVPSPNEDFIAVAGKHWYSLGLKSDSTIVAWGLNSHGQCNVPSPNQNFVAFATGHGFALGVKSDGTIVAWGWNNDGQCNVPAPNADFVAVAGGARHSLGLKSDGTVVAWGMNDDGQCNVPLPNEGFVAVEAGFYYSLGLKSDGTIVGWGSNGHGQCNVPSPNEGFAAIATGWYHSIGLKSDGTVVAWGLNYYGQCDVPSPNGGFIAIAGGGEYSLGVRRVGPSPWIVDVSDVGNDQGRRVRMMWTRSGYDAPGDTVSITGYGIYRRQDQYMSALGTEAAMPSEYPDMLRVPKLDGWDYVATVPARGDSVYQFVAPTLCDSTAAHGICWSTFFVSAMTPDPLVYYDSVPDSGYSVDNLAPSTPRGVAGQYDYSPSLLTLHWHPNFETDLSGYRAYRGQEADFVPTEENLIATTTDTLVSGLPYFPVYPWYIKVSAVDINGNESSHAVLPPEHVPVPTFVTRFDAMWKNNAVEVSWVLADAGANLNVRVSRKKGDNGQYRDFPSEILGSDDHYYFLDRSTGPGCTYFYRVVLAEDGAPEAIFETTVTTPAARLALSQNYPNPFNPSTMIELSLEEEAPVSLRVYDISGRLVTTLIDQVMPPGAHSRQWNGRDGSGISVASGFYFYRLTAGNHTLTRKMVLLR